MSNRTKIISSFLLLMLVVTGVCLLVFRTTIQVTTKFAQVGTENVPVANMISRISHRFTRLVVDAEGYLLTGDERQVAAFEQTLKLVDAAIRAYAMLVEKPSGHEGGDIPAPLVANVETFRGHADRLRKVGAVALAVNPRSLSTDRRILLWRSLWGAHDAAARDLDRALALERTQVAERLRDIGLDISQLRERNAMAAGVAGFLAIGLALMTSKSITIAAARDSAVGAARLKTEFLATMSHELRTPLTGVIGANGLLLDTELTDEQRELALLVQKAGNNQLALINDILDLSKIEAGKLAIEPYPFNLQDTVRETVALVAVQAEQKGLQFDVEYAPDTPTQVIGDAGRIRQILTNLLGNAVKFTEEGSVAMRVECRRQANRCAQFRFVVTDTGIGIPEEHQPLIFDKFTQVDGSDTRQFGGTGLGLAITKQLVQGMEGRIRVTSAVGKGSTFEVTIGLALVAGAEEEMPGDGSTDDRDAAPTTRRWEGVRVLIVEDNIANQKVAALLLQAVGCRADVAANGVDAVNMVQSFPYDLIFMDCSMPEMDGFEASRQIRALDGDVGRTPIVAMTAGAIQGDRDACTEAGMNDYMSKPVTPPKLEAVLTRFAPVGAFAEGQSDSVADPGRRAA